VSAATLADPPTGPNGVLADLDGDRVDDGLEVTLATSRPGDRLDVVATFEHLGDADAVRATLPEAAVKARFGLIDGFAARVTAAQARSLATQPGLIRLEPDFEVRAAMEAADRDFGTERARTDYGVNGAGLEICVVDTGVDPNHEQLDSKAPIPFRDLVNGRSVAYDDQGHGTHVASIAAGDGTGGSIAAMFNGVAPAASLSSVKVLDASGIGQDSNVVLGIEWCVGRGTVDVINVSITSELGSDGLDAISQAVDAAVTQHGIVVVAAAGNTGDIPGSVASPASARQAITVGAVAEWSAPAGQPWRSEGVYLAPFSSRGPTIDGRIKPDVVAPGVSIGAASAGSTNVYEIKDGTSMASPFVAGLVALMLDQRPTWTPADVKTAITSTAHDVGAPGADPEWGAGLVDGLGAVAAAAGTTAATPFPKHQRFTGSVGSSGAWTQTFTVGTGDLGAPIAATVILDGAPTCVLPWFDGCLWWEWAPDLEAELIGPSGFSLTASTCAADDECGAGRQETLHITPTAAGTYTLRVWPAAGVGGSFAIDLFTGPVGTAPPPPPPPQVHVGDIDRASSWVTSTKWKAQATVEVHDGAHAFVPGAVVKGTWTGGRSAQCTTNTNGRCMMSTQYRKAKTSVTFTVTGVTATGTTYAATANHDPDGDSDGTSIVVARP
jgi:serine protease AprX